MKYRCFRHMWEGQGVCTACASEPLVVPPLTAGEVLQAHDRVLAGVKNDSEKAARPELLPVEALEEISKVLAFGAKKYADNNWRGGFKWTRVLGALFRHLYAWGRGEDKDPETGLSHLAHAGCNILFLLTFELTKTGQDDRHRYG
jgi:hypothetical protein